MNLQETKIMKSNSINIDNHTLQLVEEYYLRHSIRLGRKRISLAWAAHRKLAYILNEPKVPFFLKRKLYDASLLPVIWYGLESPRQKKCTITTGLSTYNSGN